MTSTLHDPDEEGEILSAWMAVQDCQVIYLRLHAAAAARLLRLVFSDAASVVVDASDICGHNDSDAGEVILTEVRDARNRTLWTSDDLPPATSHIGASWPAVLGAVESHFADSFDDSYLDAVGWDDALDGELDNYALRLPAPARTH